MSCIYFSIEKWWPEWYFRKDVFKKKFSIIFENRKNIKKKH